MGRNPYSTLDKCVADIVDCYPRCVEQAALGVLTHAHEILAAEWATLPLRVESYYQAALEGPDILKAGEVDAWVSQAPDAPSYSFALAIAAKLSLQPRRDRKEILSALADVCSYSRHTIEHVKSAGIGSRKLTEIELEWQIEYLEALQAGLSSVPPATRLRNSLLAA